MAAGRILVVVAPDSAPVRRSVSEARKQGQVVDATAGHRTRSVVYMDTGQLVLSALAPETLAARVHRLEHPAALAGPEPEEVAPS